MPLSEVIDAALQRIVEVSGDDMRPQPDGSRIASTVNGGTPHTPDRDRHNGPSHLVCYQFHNLGPSSVLATMGKLIESRLTQDLALEFSVADDLGETVRTLKLVYQGFDLLPNTMERYGPFVVKAGCPIAVSLARPDTEDVKHLGASS